MRGFIMRVAGSSGCSGRPRRVRPHGFRRVLPAVVSRRLLCVLHSVYGGMPGHVGRHNVFEIKFL